MPYPFTSDLPTAAEAGFDARIRGVIFAGPGPDLHPKPLGFGREGFIGGEGFLYGLSRNRSTLANQSRLMSYEIRSLTTEAGPWRDRLKTPLQSLDEAHGESAWLLDEEGLIDLLTVVEGNRSTNLVQVPRVSSFQGHRAIIGDITKRHYVADVRPIIGEDSVTFEPVHKSQDNGVTIEVSGTFGDGETTIDLDTRFQAIVDMHTLRREFDTPFGKKKAIVQVPTTTDQRLNLSTSVPDGSTLMVRLGVIEQPAKLPGVTEFAIALFGDATGTPLQARGTLIEHFALITPRRILPAEEEERLGIPPVELPASAP